MDTQELSLNTMIKQKLNYLEQRQKLVAANIANSDTPDYRPGDLKEQNFKEVLKSSSSISSGNVSKTNSSHIEILGNGDDVLKASGQKHVYETVHGGNSVVLEEQLIKLNEIDAEHRLATNLYAKQKSLYKMALGK